MQIPHRPGPARAGFSLVDVCIAIAILAIALGTLVGSVFWALRLEEANEETALASQALRSMVDRMNAMPFGDIYAAYNADPDDDPDPLVDHLAELAAEARLLGLGGKAGPVLAVSFPGDDVGELREDVVDPRLGMPRDLDGDGGWDDADHSSDYTLLPATLRLEWEGPSGLRTLEMAALLRSP
jgi:hypothetical protein